MLQQDYAATHPFDQKSRNCNYWTYHDCDNCTTVVQEKKLRIVVLKGQVKNLILHFAMYLFPLGYSGHLHDHLCPFHL